MINVVKVWVDDKYVHILTDEGIERRELIENYEKLRNASAEELQNFETDNIGIHWPDLDEDFSYEGFFKKDELSTKSDLYRIFKSLPEINVSSIARRLGIQQSLMASYISGTKVPSAARRLQLINALHDVGKELLAVV